MPSITKVDVIRDYQEMLKSLARDIDGIKTLLKTPGLAEAELEYLEGWRAGIQDRVVQILSRLEALDK